ncbi:hypothetical protein ACHAXT_008087 [Thalassiosira profunda]
MAIPSPGDGVIDAARTQRGGAAADDAQATSARAPRLSNPQVHLPLHTLCELPNVVTAEEAAALVKVIDNQHHGQWCPEGYDRRHRVQRYSSGDDGGDTSRSDADGEEGSDAGEAAAASKMEDAFGWIFERIASRSQLQGLRRPSEVVVVEHTPLSCRSEVKTFEQNALCACSSDGNDSSDCNCYVAQLTLVNNAVQSIEKPLRRELECWDLAQPAEQHQTNFIMERNGVVIKTGESLWEWRGRVSSIHKHKVAVSASDGICVEMSDLSVDTNEKKPWAKGDKVDASKRCITVTFRGIREADNMTDFSDMGLRVPIETKPTRPLSELLTIIVTTSPIRSNPSTELLERTFDTFSFAGDDFAYECSKVIVCDGCRVLDEESDREEKKDESNPPKITRKYSNVKQTLRNGIATIDQAENYQEFKRRLRKLCDEANASDRTKNPFRNARVVELDERHGYGFALRHALYHCVDTPYVCVIQHDRTFMRPTPIKATIHAMENNPNQRIKYVGLSMRSNLMPYDIFAGKYGRRDIDDFKSMILRPEELRIGGHVYGANGSSVDNMTPPKNEKRRKVQEALIKTYRGSHQYRNYQEQSKGEEKKDGFHQLTLTPTLYWYDNTHIVRTWHYRDFVFKPQYKMVARGGFVEDKLSPCMIRSCERLGLREGHAKFGCYILDDHSGLMFTGHLDGGSFLTADLHRDPKNDRYAAKSAGSGTSGRSDSG